MPFVALYAASRSSGLSKGAGHAKTDPISVNSRGCASSDGCFGAVWRGDDRSESVVGRVKESSPWITGEFWVLARGVVIVYLVWGLLIEDSADLGVENVAGACLESA